MARDKCGTMGRRAQMQERASRENAEDYKPVRRGWCLGEKTFRKELLGQMAGRVGQSMDVCSGQIALFI